MRRENVGHHAKVVKGVGALGDYFSGIFIPLRTYLLCGSGVRLWGITLRTQRGAGALGICFLGMMQKKIPLRTYLLCGLCVMHVMQVRCDSEAMDYALHSIGQYRITEIKKKTQMFIGYFQIG